MLSFSIGTNPPVSGETPFEVMDFEEAGGFKRSLQQGYEKRDPEPDAFSMLPPCLVDEIGVKTHKGARIDLAILSHMYHMFGRSVYAEPIQFEQGFTEELESGEFIVSMQTTAEDVLSRWSYQLKRSDLENPDGSRTKTFEAFYRTVVRGFKRLEALGYIERRRYVNGKHNGIYGTVWVLSPEMMGIAQQAPKCPPPPPVLIHADIPITGEWVSAVDRIGKHFLSESSALYAMGEACTSVKDRGRFLQHENWCDVVADNQPDQPRHVSIGAFKSAKWIDENTPCTVPWVILEAEAGDIVDRYGATRRMLETLDTEGVDISRIVVTYSGNQSFHIRIPQGMFGNPVFSGVEQCRRVLSRWAYDHFDEHLDVNLFDPRHLIRCTGSKHEKGGRVTPFSGDEFMNGLEYVLTNTSRFNPHKASPRLVPADPWLMVSLADAADSLSRFWIMAYEDAPTISESGVYAAAMKGCAEGEQWHEKHVGRSKLCFVAACYLFGKYGEAAYAELEEVNERNSPPLHDHELRQCFKSAKRTILRSGAKSNR